MDIKDYKLYKGFEDLREYKIRKRLFVKLWKIQDFLYSYSKNSEYHKKHNTIQWQKAKEISAEYCLILQGLKKNAV